MLSCQKETETDCVWDYPVKPGTDEWVNLDSYNERIKVCQIPDKILFCLSTEKLTDICLRYPFIYDVFAFNDWNAGLDNLFSTFNGIRELYKRTDVSKELLKRYQAKMHKISLFAETDSEPDEELFNLSICALEWLLARYTQMNEATIDNCKEILQNLVVGYETENLYESKRGGLYVCSSNLFARAHVIVKICQLCIEKIPQGHNNLIFSCNYNDIETTGAIDELSYELIK